MQGRIGKQRLDVEVQRLEGAAADLQRFAVGVPAKPRPLPAVHDVDSYLNVRVHESQIQKYADPEILTSRTPVNCGNGFASRRQSR